MILAYAAERHWIQSKNVNKNQIRIKNGRTWCNMVLTYFNIFFEKRKKNVLKWYKCIPFLPACEIIKEILNKKLIAIIESDLEKNTTKQKFYRKLKVNHINITSLLFAVTDLIKGNNLFCNHGWQSAMVESW